jgi:uncharacterized membrane protein
MSDAETRVWRATLTPHRSLSRRDFHVLIGVIAAINMAVGLYFYWIGAWPVVGFMGLDVAAVWWAFNRNFAAARRAEHIEVNRHELVLARTAENRAPQELRFVRRWVQVELQEDRDRDLIGSLYLRTSGVRTEIASFLSPPERKELARALQQALVNPTI